MSSKILRLPAVRAQTGLSRSTIYLRLNQGTFPQPVSLGGRAIGWLESDVNAWLEKLIPRRPGNLSAHVVRSPIAMA